MVALVACPLFLRSVEALGNTSNVVAEVNRLGLSITRTCAWNFFSETCYQYTDSASPVPDYHRGFTVTLSVYMLFLANEVRITPFFFFAVALSLHLLQRGDQAGCDKGQ